VDSLFLGVIRLGKAAQKHCRSGDVLVHPSELWEIVPPIHGVVLDPMDASLSVAHRFMRMGCDVVR